MSPVVAMVLLCAAAAGLSDVGRGGRPEGLATVSPAATPTQTPTPTATQTAGLACTINTAVAEELRSLVASPRLPGLRWPGLRDVHRDLRRLYEARAFAPLFLREGRPTPQARVVARVLADAGQKGLAPEDYEGLRWAGQLSAAEAGPAAPAALAGLDFGLVVSTLRYALALRRGRVGPRAMDQPLPPVRGPVDLAASAALLSASGDPEAVLGALEPAVEPYRWLLEALARTRAAEAQLRGRRPPAMPRRTVEPGGAYADAGRLSELLVALGDLPGPGEPEAAWLTPALSEGLARFQARHQLPPDGRLGRRTAEALAVPLQRRVKQIELALEQWRWLPDELAGPPIVVNIPAFQLLAFGDGPGELGVALTMDVIVGRDEERRRTPLLARRLEQVVFAPWWEVPPALALEELVPRLEQDPGLADRSGFVVEGPGGARPADAAALALVRAGKARLRQRPGPENALGRVKFALDEGDVYLHDTPTRKLFARRARALSHGCIRLSDPAGLAAYLLRGRPEWSRERIGEAMAEETSTFVPLERPPWIFALHATASAGADRRPRFADDVYGLERKLEKALARGYPYLR